MANNKFLEETGLSRLWAHTKKLVAEVELKISCPYDVGDVLATKNPQNPSERWAGTKWQRVEGSFIVGYKESDADFGTLGKTGGTKTEILTIEQIPAHNHSATTSSAGAHTHPVSGTAESAGSHDHKIVLKTKSGGVHNTDTGINDGSWTENLPNAWLDQSPIQHAGAHTHPVSGTATSGGAHTHTVTINNTGGSKAHNNLPPYKVYYIWERIA